jgi:radical SAM superfamily enzyme YgiQ (UPF0313 family)
VLGGYFPTFEYEYILNNNHSVDYVVVGEGENTFSELLATLESKKGVENILGLCYRKNGKVVFNGNRPFIKNLDTLSFPARHLVNAYAGYVVTSRGCPYNCAFCCSKKFYNRTHRKRSVENVLEELTFLKKSGYKILRFVDDHFLLDRDYAKKLCKAIIRNGLNSIRYTCMTKIHDIIRNEDLIPLLEKANITAMGIGLQSLREEKLKEFNTGFGIKDVEKFLNFLENYVGKIKFTLFYILDSRSVEEMRKERKAIRKFFKMRNRNFSIEPFILVPFPGSDIAKNNSQNRWEALDMWHYTDNPWEDEEIRHEFVGFMSDLDKYGLMFDGNSLSTKIFLKLPQLFSLAYYVNILTSSFPLRIKATILKDVIKLEKKLFFSPYREKKYQFDKMMKTNYF